MGLPLPKQKLKSIPLPTLNVDQSDDYEVEERAAIIEYDGGLPRNLAEFMARKIIEKKGSE
jgi:hypothetical protein